MHIWNLVDPNIRPNSRFPVLVVQVPIQSQQIAYLVISVTAGHTLL